MVHESPLSDRSPFFKAAFAERWNQAVEKKPIELVGDDADIFDIYLHALYRGTVDIGDVVEALAGELGLADRSVDTIIGLRLAKAYIFADKVGDVVTANVLVDELKNYYCDENEVPCAFIVALVAANTVRRSPLRQLIIDFYVRRARMYETADIVHDDTVPRSILGEILLEKNALDDEYREELVQEAFSLDFICQESCRYHQHDDARPSCGEHCSNCKEVDEEEDGY